MLPPISSPSRRRASADRSTLHCFADLAVSCEATWNSTANHQGGQRVGASEAEPCGAFSNHSQTASQIPARAVARLAEGSCFRLPGIRSDMTSMSVPEFLRLSTAVRH